MQKIHIAVSSCLLGNPVRYDGDHKRNSFITEHIGKFVEFEAFCPETAIGLGVPRPPIQLRQTKDGVRVVDVATGQNDFTQPLRAYSVRMAKEWERVCGVIVKARSPSCGMLGVNRIDNDGEIREDGIGMFTAELLAQRPELPIEEDERLLDPMHRDNFFERTFVLKRWHEMQSGTLNVNVLQDFHRRHKFAIQAHDEQIYRELGNLVAGSRANNLVSQAEQYLQRMMHAMNKTASPGAHCNVLMHLLGFLKRQLDADQKRALLDLIDQYNDGDVPLSEPKALLRKYCRQYNNDYLAEQTYLYMDPVEQLLREE